MQSNINSDNQTTNVYNKNNLSDTYSTRAIKNTDLNTFSNQVNLVLNTGGSIFSLNQAQQSNELTSSLIENSGQSYAQQENSINQKLLSLIFTNNNFNSINNFNSLLSNENVQANLTSNSNISQSYQTLYQIPQSNNIELNIHQQSNYPYQQNVSSNELIINNNNKKSSTQNLSSSTLYNTKNLASNDIIKQNTDTKDDNTKPFKCLQCFKSFSKKVYLSQHSRIHSNERPYLCDKCDRRFTQLSHLYQHKRRHTGRFKFFFELEPVAF